MPLQKQKLLFETVRTRQVICILTGNPVSTRLCDTTVQRRSQPLILGTVYQLNPAIQLSQCQQQAPGLLGGTVISDDEFKIAHCLSQDRCHCLREHIRCFNIVYPHKNGQPGALFSAAYSATTPIHIHSIDTTIASTTAKTRLSHMAIAAPASLLAQGVVISDGPHALE